MWDIFGVAKISNIFWGCLKFLIFFWGEWQMLGPSLHMQKEIEYPPPPRPRGVGHVQAGIFFALYEGPRWGQHIPAEGVQVCCRQSL